MSRLLPIWDRDGMLGHSLNNVLVVFVGGRVGIVCYKGNIRTAGLGSIESAMVVANVTRRGKFGNHL